MTRGSHAPSLTTLARRALLEAGLSEPDEAGVPRDLAILCAVSGGPDSMALLHVLSLLARPRSGRRHATTPFRLAACGVDHGLRPAAKEELRLASELAAKLGVPFSLRTLDVKEGPNLQARAREARHQALLEEAARLGPHTLVATAHHADDRAETFLLRLTRGAGLRGLAVLPLREGHLVRPLLRARRRDIETHLARHQLPHAQDPSNADLRFARVQIRSQVLPALLALDPRFVEHVADVCDELVTRRRGGPSEPELSSLGRRNREALARLARGDATKMAVRLPNQRSATYDWAEGAVVIHAPGPVEANTTEARRTPRKLP